MGAMSFSSCRLVIFVGLVSAFISAAKPTSLKWAQYRDGTLIATFPLKRGKGELCANEAASIAGSVLHYTMDCGGDLYELKVELQHAVDESRVVLRRERAYAVVTLQKASAAVWWSNFAKHP